MVTSESIPSLLDTPPPPCQLDAIIVDIEVVQQLDDPNAEEPDVNVEIDNNDDIVAIQDNDGNDEHQDDDDLDDMPALVNNFESALEHVPPWHININFKQTNNTLNSSEPNYVVSNCILT